MGALHQGHFSLLQKSNETADKTVCSIFVNPTQFNNAEDFAKYPVNTEHDIYLLEKWKCDVLFLPNVNEIYPSEESKRESFDLGDIENILEGKYRPGHFQGVCMVVKSLLQIVSPTWLFAGQKDYQQCLVLQKLIQIINSKTELVICPTVREKDGLAMSSRNQRLNEDERRTAPGIFEMLTYIKQQVKPGSLQYLKEIGVDVLNRKGFKTDYVEIANAANLQTADVWDGRLPLVILTAAYLNNIRLIDNIKL